jgi:hypothetical protein
MSLPAEAKSYHERPQRATAATARDVVTTRTLSQLDRAIIGTWPAAVAPRESVAVLARAFVADDLEATRHERGLPD